jgi:hypothetical protein
MRNTYPASLALLVVVICAGIASAQIPTVILSNNKDATFQIQWKGETKTPKDIVFSLDPVALPQDAKVKQCELRVVVDRPTREAVTGQDVAVFDSSKQQIGELHVSGEDRWSEKGTPPPLPYRTLLRPESCEPKSKSLTMTLESKSRKTDWTYYGGADATDSAKRPRLIVTYTSPSRPNPGRSGQSTDWKYDKPDGFFKSPLGPGQPLRTNPVWYAGAVYVVADSSLYRVAGAQNVTSWKLNFTVDANSFAFVSAWGRLQIIGTAIHSCDLTTLATMDRAGTLDCAGTSTDKIALNAGETPAMGPDGSLYFKTVEAAGSIVARNPERKEIWRTVRKLTKVSPITFSANGQYAYVLAEISLENGKERALVSIDTATGETVREKIVDKGTNPDLMELFRPAVVSKVINNKIKVDYVFVAGNTSDLGLLQCVAFEQGALPRVVWTRPGKVASDPVPSVVDGDSLFVVQDGKLKRYTWFSKQAGSEGPKSDPEIEETQALSLGSEPRATLLVDGRDSVYVYANGSLEAYTSVLKSMSTAQKLEPAPKVFTTSGALIGYDGTNVYDLSPKVGGNLSPPALATWTIYSANTTTAPKDPGIKAGDRVTLKGNNITLPNGFQWPLGATLNLESVQ